MPAEHAPAGTWTTACIALGSNLGDRAGHIRSALDAIAATPGIRLLAASRMVETDPVGPVPQGRYLNAAAVVSTSLPCRALLDRLLEIERAMGRDRTAEQRWGPRTLDLDLLLFGDQIIREPGLVVPHPRLHERAFVLIPLAEVSPEFIVPTLGRTVRALLDDLPASAPAPTGAGKE
jgi:2-amino-4-hydroxy-6-hydroxymethyldihydropteridine diphosphokinase